MPSRRRCFSGPSASAKPDTATSKKQKKTGEVLVKEVVLGNAVMTPVHGANYPVELVGTEVEKLYVCEFCFKYTDDVSKIVGHSRFCEPAHGGALAGTLEYTIDERYSIYKVDGETDNLFCTNMCLFAKLFMADKSIYYEVKGFVFYTLVKTTPAPSNGAPPLRRVLGFFSKEKMSWDDYNLACILVFPPFQRGGLGRKLIAYSYLLSKYEDKVGSPEKPISALGLIGYTRYWVSVLAGVILYPHASIAARPLSISDISRMTMILPDDITATLRKMNAIEKDTDGNVILSAARVQQYVAENRVRVSECVERDGEFWYQ